MPTPLRIVLVICVQKLVKWGCRALLAHLWDDSSTITLITSILVVCEFLEVFPDNFTSMPPDHEFDFCIELELRTLPISIPPYRMASKELRELKS